MTRYREREITTSLLAALKEMPVVIITGMRQSGKSTLLQRDPNLRNRRYISLDDFAALQAAEEDPEGLIESEEAITIDEVQKVPQLLQVIKRKVDKKRVPGRYILSGSANLALLKNVSETLAGRAVYMTLFPMNRREISETVDGEPYLLKFMRKNRLPSAKQTKPIKDNDILIGGMPSVALKEVKDKSIWFKGYEQTYLERDVTQISQVADVIAFRNLLHLTALRTGQVLNQSELGRDAKLNSTTISRYLSLFEISFLISRVAPYYSSKATRLIKSPKIYMADSGMTAYLLGIEDAKGGLNFPTPGALLETFVAQNLMSLISYRLRAAGVFFWNIQGRHEVDFVIEYGGRALAVEVKQGSRWKNKDLNGLRAFLENTPHCQAGILAYNGTEAVSLGDKIWAIPLGLLLS